MTEREQHDHDDDLAAHAAMTPPDTEPVEDEVPPIEAIADDDIAHAADTPPGTETEPDENIPPPPDEAQLHSTLISDPMADPGAIEDGEMIRQIEELFPVAWLAMLAAVCYIAIYFAVDQLPNVGDNPLPGPGWF